MEDPTINSLFNKETLSMRLTAQDRQFLSENFELVTGDEQVNTVRRFLLAAVDRAISKTKIIEKTVNVNQADPEQAQEIERLKNDIEQWKEFFSGLENRFKDYLIIAKRDKLANNYIDLFSEILKSMQNGIKYNGKIYTAWILDENDKKYIAEHGHE